MTVSDPQNFHTAGEEWLVSSAAGTLTRGKSLVLACQAEMQPALAQRLADVDTLGGTMLESARGEEISDGFLDRMMSALDGSGPSGQAQDDTHSAEPDESWMPRSLHAFLSGAGIDLKWRRAGPGVQRAPLFTDEDGERVYLLRAAPGLALPVHSHHGDEWTLILQGSYKAGEDKFIPGDLHHADQDCEHQPVIDQVATCICLVADDGPLKFRNPLLRLLQPLFRI